MAFLEYDFNDFVVLYDILHYCNLPYERSETESSRFENNVTSSHTL